MTRCVMKKRWLNPEVEVTRLSAQSVLEVSPGHDGGVPDIDWPDLGGGTTYNTNEWDKVNS